jgi:hypothetical protein
LVDNPTALQKLSSKEYPTLVPEGQPVETLGVPAVLAVFKQVAGTSQRQGEQECTHVCLMVSGFRRARSETRSSRGRQPSPSNWHRTSMSGDGCFAVADTIHCAVEVVGDQHRPVLKDYHVGRAANVIVILDKTSDERLDRLHGAVLV